MKKILKSLALFLLFVPLCACEDFLDREPITEYERYELVNNVKGLETLLNGAYSIIKSGGYYGRNMHLIEAAKGVDFVCRDASGGTSMYYECRWSMSSGVGGNASTMWRTIYQLIYQVNIILDSIDKIGADDQNTIYRIKGEALAIRALAYFDLTRLFCYPPIFAYRSTTHNGSKIENDAATTADKSWDAKVYLGLPIIVNSKMAENINKYQATLERDEELSTTFDYIFRDINEAKTLLEGQPVTPGRMGAAAASALRMRMLLYCEMWDEVVAEGEEWIAKYSGNYSMMPYSSFATTYYKSFNTENIWELEYNSYTNLGSNGVNYWVRKPTYDDPNDDRYGQAKSNIGYSKLLFSYDNANRGLDFLSYYENDVRKALICDLGVPQKPEYKTCRRFIGEISHNVYNIPLIRLPEIYLTLAEAYFNINNQSEAGRYASIVSQARRLADITGATNTDIYDERRREFVMDAHTFWDYNRTARNLSNKQLIELGRVTGITLTTVLPEGGSNYRRVYPIPLYELDVSIAMRNQQNFYYSGYTPYVEEDV